MKTLKSIGFVLRSKPFLEKDLLLTVFSRDYGLITALAKGIKGSAKFKANAFLLFSKIEFEILEPRSKGSLYKMISADALKSYAFFDIGVLASASFCAELLIGFLQEQHPVSKLFELVDEIFDFLANHEHCHHFAMIFLIKIMSILGLIGDFSYCSKCENKFSANSRVTWRRSGEVVCQDCDQRQGDLVEFTELKILNFWQKANFSSAICVDIEERNAANIYRLLELELNKHLHYNLKSLSVLKDLKLNGF